MHFHICIWEHLVLFSCKQLNSMFHGKLIECNYFSIAVIWIALILLFLQALPQ